MHLDTRMSIHMSIYMTALATISARPSWALRPGLHPVCCVWSVVRSAGAGIGVYGKFQQLNKDTDTIADDMPLWMTTSYKRSMEVWPANYRPAGVRLGEMLGDQQGTLVPVELGRTRLRRAAFHQDLLARGGY